MRSRFLPSLLAFAERTLKTDVRYLVRGGVWSAIGQTGVTAAAFVLSIAFARYVPKEIYGEYKFVLAFVAVLGAFSLNGVGTAVFQSAARGFNGALPAGLRASLRWSVLIFLGALAAGTYYLLAGNLTLGIGILMGGSLTPFIIAANLYTAFLAGKRDFKRQSLYGGVWSTVLPACALLGAVLLAPKSPLILLAVYFVSNLLAGLYFYFLTIRIYPPKPHEQDPEMLSYAKHLSGIGILNTLAGNVDQLLLFHFIGATSIAVYAFATGVVDQIKGPLKTFDSMVQARFAVQEGQSIRHGMGNKMLWLFGFSVIFVVAYVLAAPTLYAIFFPTYHEAVLYSQVYAISMLATLFGPAGSFLTAKKKVRAQYISNIVNAILQITAVFVGIVFWGLWGLIWARVFVRIVGSAVTYVLYRLTPDHA